MAKYFYAPKVTEGLLELMSLQDATRIRYHDGLNFRKKGMSFLPKEEDIVICWGASVPPMKGVRMINASGQYPNDALLNAGVSRTKPVFLLPKVYIYPSELAYQRDVDLITGDLAGKSTISGYTPNLDVPNMGYAPFGHAGYIAIRMFDGQLISAKKKTAQDPTWQPYKISSDSGFLVKVRQFLDSMDLIFGELVLFRVSSKSNPYVFHHVSTAPTLDAVDVVALSQELDHWVANGPRVIAREVPVIEDTVADSGGPF